MSSPVVFVTLVVTVAITLYVIIVLKIVPSSSLDPPSSLDYTRQYEDPYVHELGTDAVASCSFMHNSAYVTETSLVINGHRHVLNDSLGVLSCNHEYVYVPTRRRVHQYRWRDGEEDKGIDIENVISVHVHRHSIYCSVMDNDTMRGHVVEYRHGEEHSVVRGDTQGFGRNVAVTDMFLFVASIAAVDVYTRQGYCDEKREWKHVTSFSPTNDAAFATTMVAVDKMLYIGSPRESLVYIYDMRHWTEPVLLEGRAGFGCGMREEQGTVMIASNKTTTWVRNGEIVEEREERHGSQRCV